MPAMKVWTNGTEFVATSDRQRIPAVLDEHYRVRGHRLRDCWREVDATTLVAVCLHATTVLLPAADLGPVKHEAWLGKITPADQL